VKRRKLFIYYRRHTRKARSATRVEIRMRLKRKRLTSDYIVEQIRGEGRTVSAERKVA